MRTERGGTLWRQGPGVLQNVPVAVGQTPVCVQCSLPLNGLPELVAKCAG